MSNLLTYLTKCVNYCNSYPFSARSTLNRQSTTIGISLKYDTLTNFEALPFHRYTCTTNHTMSLSLWRERIKICGLVMAVLLCLCTLWTTFSFGMGPRDVPRLQVRQTSLGSWCDPYEKLNSISSIEVQRCHRAVHHAYKWMNLMGTCLREEQHVVLCELEWCTRGTGGSTSISRCRTECDMVRSSLQKCIDTQVQASLRSFGMQ